MKRRISFTIEESLDNKVERLLKDSRYRNKSHFIEQAIKKFVEEHHE